LELRAHGMVFLISPRRGTDPSPRQLTGW
jgi:hypothetical protein